MFILFSKDRRLNSIDLHSDFLKIGIVMVLTVIYVYTYVHI